MVQLYVYVLITFAMLPTLAVLKSQANPTCMHHVSMDKINSFQGKSIRRFVLSRPITRRKRVALHSYNRIMSLAEVDSHISVLNLTPPDDGADIIVFGTSHGDAKGSFIGEYILKERPHTVVVETALNASHGFATGNAVELHDCLYQSKGPLEGRTQAIAHLALKLSEIIDAHKTTLWRDLAVNPVMYSEHLAYVAALAVGSRLVFGDRPKHVTYQRMLWKPEVEDLDAAFGLYSVSNYCDLAPSVRTSYPTTLSTSTDLIFIGERNAVLLDSLHKASTEAGKGRLVVGVVGLSHIEGMAKLWKDQSWQHIISSGSIMDLPGKAFNLEDESPERIGVRRALFDSVIRLTCHNDVLNDINATLGEPTARALPSYLLTRELYGSSRMLLATLEKDQLSHICGSWRCKMWEVLEPLRAVRPVNGGPGYDEELIMQLRTLNFEIS